MSVTRSTLPIRVSQTFSATSPKHATSSPLLRRRLHITGAQATPSQYLKFEALVAGLPRQSKGNLVNRHINTSRSLKAVHDSSTIDFAYMPTFDYSEPSNSSVYRIPMLPDNYTSSRSSSLGEGVEPVIRPEIAMVSGEDGQGGVVVSAMSDVTDSGAMEVDVYGLTEVVNKAREGAQRVKEELLDGSKEESVLSGVWKGFVDDLLGERVRKA